MPRNKSASLFPNADYDTGQKGIGDSSRQSKNSFDTERKTEGNEMKTTLTVKVLVHEAKDFAQRESRHCERTLFGVTDGKAVSERSIRTSRARQPRALISRNSGLTSKSPVSSNPSPHVRLRLPARRSTAWVTHSWSSSTPRRTTGRAGPRRSISTMSSLWKPAEPLTSRRPRESSRFSTIPGTSTTS